MSSIVISGNTSGAITISAPAVSGTNTLTLPAVTDTLVGLDATQTLTNKSIVATQLTGTIAAARLPAGSVLQVVSTTKTDTFSSSSTSYTDITGFSVSITPTSSSSKILVFGHLTSSSGLQGSVTGYFQLVRGSTAIGNGTDGIAINNSADSSFTTQICFNYLDSPATTSSTTYKIQSKGDGATWYINRPVARSLVCSSTITVMEIAA